MKVLLPLVLAGWLIDLSARRRPRLVSARAGRTLSGRGPFGGPFLGPFVGQLVAAAVVGQLVLPGVGGALVPAGVALALWRRDRTRAPDPAIRAWTPTAADLLAACLVGGLDPHQALAAVSPVAPPGAAARLAEVATALGLGADQRSAWGELRDDPDWRGIARSFIRSSDSGAPLAQLLIDWADERRADAVAQTRAAVRAAGVKVVLPVGLCFLPAFVLVGVVPIVAGLISTFAR